MKNKRRIAIFTGNRAEYGLLYPVLKEIKKNPNFDLRLLVSGAHLDSNFGRTMKDITNDGFEIEAEIKIPFDMSELSSTATAIGSAVLSLVDVLKKLKPDIFVVYADRFEGFAATIAATQMCIPTAHIEGGDITEGGALDDSVRHAMTKLAHMHFTTNQQAANRILGMGEESWRVHNVGFPGIDLIKEGRVSDRKVLEEKYHLDLEKPLLVFTQHSVAVEFKDTEKNIEESMIALHQLADKSVQVILTYPNNDVGCQIIIDSMNKWFQKKLHPNIQIHKSLGQANYYGVLALARDAKMRVACVGNSSSGIKETPAFGCPTVNIGSRQSGRLRAENVLDAQYNADEIYQKINKALFDEHFRLVCLNVENPYGQGNSSKKIAEILQNAILNSTLLNKKMTLKGGFYK